MLKVKWSNEEIVSSGEEALDGIKSAISALEMIEEYKEILEQLKDIKNELENEIEPYQEALDEEDIHEQERANSEYEREVL